MRHFQEKERDKKSGKKRNRRTWGDVVNISILLVFVVACIYPFWYIFIGSISNPQIPVRTLTLLPKEVTLFNYKEVVQLEGIFNAMCISVARTVIGAVTTVLFTSYMGYMFTQKKIPARKFWYRMIIITMYLGSGIIPYFLTIKSYGLMNSFWVYIIPGIFGVYNMILVKTFMENSVPESLPESAQLDGAGILTIFFKIVLPVSKPILATIALFVAVGQWSSWYDNMIYNVATDKYDTLQLLLYRMLNNAQQLNQTTISNNQAATAMFEQLEKQKELTPDSIRMTLTMVVTVPILLVYPFIQKYFVKGFMIGAVKG